jgi:tetratricopeptide (TPR) repeat protein
VAPHPGRPRLVEAPAATAVALTTLNVQRRTSAMYTSSSSTQAVRGLQSRPGRRARFAFAFVLAFGLLPAAGAQICGSLSNDDFGPYDYRTAEPKLLREVETYHFTTKVETLRGGESTYIGGDLDYTLRAFPNHTRALLAMVRLSEKEKRDQPQGSRYSVDCWFDRAVRYAPDDGQVRMVYGFHLARKGQPQQAVKELEQARALIGEDANVHYNLGLAYFDLKDFDKSLYHAQQAYRLGFALPGLKNKLEQAGRWREGPVSARPGTPPAR